ncbi:ig-like domain-containing protein [Trichonephila clavipes]|uniref:Ig-like domain-containing protein n=1 Tax=Trichonephila clavipes TaxID=2585209 RepID=A0A8X6UTR7_TRICX|nr:ig-like domain-containing protein [Trichonephila clavipes]
MGVAQFKRLFKNRFLGLLLTLEVKVSWIRRTDFHVLTVGIETYTSDERFEALHLQKSNDWTLQIKYTQLRDSGTYECQVSSDPKISFFVNLTIVVPTKDVISWVFNESSELDQVVTIYYSMAADRAGLVNSHAMPVEVYSQKVMSDS